MTPEVETSAFQSEAHFLTSRSGRRVAVWRSCPERSLDRGISAVLSPGLGHTMRHLGAVALWLVRNGVTVYRFDHLDHCGLSDGGIEDLNFPAFLESLQTAQAFAWAHESGRPFCTVAMSVSTPAAFRAAALNGDAQSLVVSVVGVVDIGETLTRVLGHDYLQFRPEDLPARVEVERHRVNPIGFYRDIKGGDWSVEAITSSLAQTSAPVVSIVADQDAWAPPRALETALMRPQAGPRTILRLPDGTHKLDKSPHLLRLVVRAVTENVTAFGASPVGPLSEPTLGDLVVQAGVERKRERQLASAAC
jgi:pimeloyl-ACP methyl ester carboxylesterase